MYIVYICLVFAFVSNKCARDTTALRILLRILNFTQNFFNITQNRTNGFYPFYSLTTVGVI